MLPPQFLVQDMQIYQCWLRLKKIAWCNKVDEWQRCLVSLSRLTSFFLSLQMYSCAPFVESFGGAGITAHVADDPRLDNTIP